MTVSMLLVAPYKEAGARGELAARSVGLDADHLLRFLLHLIHSLCRYWRGFSMAEKGVGWNASGRRRGGLIHKGTMAAPVLADHAARPGEVLQVSGHRRLAVS